MQDINRIIEEIMSAEEVIIYGAGDMGRALKKCLESEPFNKQISAYIVQNMKNNPSDIEGSPVISISSGESYKNKLLLVALNDKIIQEALTVIQMYKFENVIPVSFDGDLWCKIRDLWFESHREILTISYRHYEAEKVSERENYEIDMPHVYVAKSVYDKQINEKMPQKEYERYIQVGATLTSETIAEIKDNVGNNISDKNRQYCELTALYWMWKNDRAPILGLSHYRRRFLIKEDKLELFERSCYDVAVTVPILNFAGVKQQYAKNHSEDDWNILLQAIQEISPQYLHTAMEVGQGIYYYAYNMFIAKREFIDAYCNWLFPILECCEQKIGDKQDLYQNRYIGFLAERMLTIFLNYHKDDYEVCIVDKHFVETEN